MSKKVHPTKKYFATELSMLHILLFACLTALSTPSLAALDSSIQLKRFTPMTQSEMETLIRSTANNVEGNSAHLQFEYEDVRMACISDSRYNRMRIISPIANEADLSAKQLKILLAANFHLTLDARYATSNGVLYAAFIHPLSSLHEKEVLAALRQVSQLVKNFGTSYSSGGLTFGGNQ